MKPMKFLVLPILIALIFTLSAKSAEASNLYLSTPSNQIQNGDSFQVDVRLNTQNEDLNAVQSNLNFPADKLEIVSITQTNSFPILAEQTVSGGLIQLAQGSLSPVNGDVPVATITFKAKSAGTANLSFNTDSAAPRFADSSDSLDLAQSSGINLTINEAGPSATPVATQTQSQTLSFASIWNLISKLFNS